MTINLSKGETISLTKESGPAGLNHVVVGLGWDPIEAHPPYDLDASAFLTDALNRCAAPTDFVFYNAPRHPSGSVNCGDDSRDGSGDGDDESLDIQLALVPPTVEKIRWWSASIRPRSEAIISAVSRMPSSASPTRVLASSWPASRCPKGPPARTVWSSASCTESGRSGISGRWATSSREGSVPPWPSTGSPESPRS